MLEFVHFKNFWSLDLVYSLVHTMPVNMLVVLLMVTQEQLATSVHASEDYAS